MDTKKLFKKLVHDHPDIFYMVDCRLAIKTCPWVVAMPDDNDVLVHDLRGITTNSFDFGNTNKTGLLYGEWQTQFYNDEAEAEQVIFASATHYNKMYRLAAKEHHNKQIEQALNNLD